MNIDEEVRVIMKQPFFLSHTEQGMLLKSIKDDMEKDGVGNVFLLMSAAYNAGLVHGKRIERSKRRRTL